VEVEDRGSAVIVRYSGRSNDDIERIRHTVTLPVHR
jgi:hypothetical protein